MVAGRVDGHSMTGIFLVSFVWSNHFAVKAFPNFFGKRPSDDKGIFFHNVVLMRFLKQVFTANHHSLDEMVDSSTANITKAQNIIAPYKTFTINQK